MFNLDLINKAGDKAMSSAKSLEQVDFITSVELEIAQEGKDQAVLSRCMKLQHSIQKKKNSPIFAPFATGKTTRFRVTQLMEETPDSQNWHGKEGMSPAGNDTLQVYCRLECIKTGIRSSMLATLRDNHNLHEIEEGTIISVPAIRLREGDQVFRMSRDDEKNNAYALLEAHNDFFFIPNGIEGSIVTESPVAVTKETVGRD